MNEDGYFFNKVLLACKISPDLCEWLALTGASTRKIAAMPQARIVSFQYSQSISVH